jgi:uncharacterized protein
MIIDAHTHIFSNNVCNNREQYFTDKNFSLLYKDPNSKITDHNDLLNMMETNNIDHSIVAGFAWIKEEFCLEQNNYFSKLLSISDKFIPFGSISLESKSDISSRVKTISDLGLKGIGEIGFYTEGLTDENRLFLTDLFEAALKYNLPVMLHLNEPVGHNYTGKYAPEFKKIVSLISKFPDLKIILAHWGGGILFYELMPEIEEAFKNVFYDTAASPYLYDDKIYEKACHIIGAEKILFGTDFPLIKPKRYIDKIKLLEDKKSSKILGNNAASLFNISI